MKNIEFKYVPLTFISTKKDIEEQIKNTVVFKTVFENYKQLVPLSDLILDTKYGFTASATKTGSHKLLRITDIKNGKVSWADVPFCVCEREANYLLKTGDVLIARTGNNISYLVTDDVPSNAVFASYLIRLSLNKTKLLPEFLYAFLNSYAFWPQILKKQRGATLQNVNANLIKQLLVPICSISEQKEILNKIDTPLTAQIDDNTKRVLNLFGHKNNIEFQLENQLSLVKQLRQAFLSEAMQGKLCIDLPSKSGDRGDTETGQQLLERIKAEKAQLIKDKKLKKEKELPPIKPEEIPFEIPEDWVWCRVGEISVIKGGKRVPIGHSLTRKPTDHIYLRVSDMKNGSIDVNDLHYIEDIVYEKIKQYTISKEDIYMTIVGGTIGKCGTIPERFHNANLTENAAKITPVILNKDYLLKCLQSPFCQNQFIDKTKQVGVQKMALNRFSNSLIPLPPLSLQNQIVEKLGELMKTCDDLGNSIKQSQVQNEQLLQQILKEALEVKNLEDVKI